MYVGSNSNGSRRALMQSRACEHCLSNQMTVATYAIERKRIVICTKRRAEQANRLRGDLSCTHLRARAPRGSLLHDCLGLTVMRTPTAMQHWLRHEQAPVHEDHVRQWRTNTPDPRAKGLPEQIPSFKKRPAADYSNAVRQGKCPSPKAKVSSDV